MGERREARRGGSTAVARPAIVVVVEALLGVVALGYALSYQFEPVVMTALALWYALDPNDDIPTNPPSGLPQHDRRPMSAGGRTHRRPASR